MLRSRTTHQWPQALKRRRILWLSAIEPRAPSRYRLLDLNDDVLLHIFRILLPHSSVLRGRTLASYRDATHFGFTCKRLAGLFITARERPVAVDAGYHEKLSPVANPRFFRSVIADTSSVLRELHLPSFPTTDISDLVFHILTVIPTLQALNLIDDGSLTLQVAKALAVSSIRTLHIEKPRAECVHAFADEEQRVFSSSFRGVSSVLFRQVFQHVKDQNMRGVRAASILLRDRSRGAWTNFLVKPHRDSPDFHFFPTFRSMLAERLESDCDGHPHISSLVMHRVRKAQRELYLELQAPTERELQYFLHPPDYLHRFNSAVGVLRLDLSSMAEVNMFLVADQRTKTRARYRTRATTSLSHIRADFLVENENNLCKLCKCLLTLISSQNTVHTLDISRELVAFADSRTVPRLLKRLKNLKTICLRNPKAQNDPGFPSLSIASDYLFLDRFPKFINLLQRNCENLEIINIDLCFPQYPFERRKELRPGITVALSSLLRYETQSSKVNVDGLRRQLLKWLERVDLNH
ncbi:unnamed protein product [Agarophyton chilense]